MELQNCVRPLKKAWTTNANTSSFASRIPTTTEPTNDGVVALTDQFGGLIAQEILILPYGLGANNDAFDMRVIGWRRVGPASGIFLWVPTILANFSCIMGNVTGVAGAPVLNTEFFCDTITLTTNNAVSQPVTKGIDSQGTPVTFSYGNLEIYSPTNDTVAWVMMRLRGVEKIELTFDQTTNTPTTNALISFV